MKLECAYCKRQFENSVPFLHCDNCRIDLQSKMNAIQERYEIAITNKKTKKEKNNEIN